MWTSAFLHTLIGESTNKLVLTAIKGYENLRYILERPRQGWRGGRQGARTLTRVASRLWKKGETARPKRAARGLLRAHCTY